MGRTLGLGSNPSHPTNLRSSNGRTSGFEPDDDSSILSLRANIKCPSVTAQSGHFFIMAKTVEERIQLAKELLAMNPQQRAMDGLPIDIRGIAKKCKIKVADLEKLQRGEEIDTSKIKTKQSRGDYNTNEYLLSHIQAIDAALVKNAANGDVRSIQEVNKLLGRGSDKVEVQIGLSPEERYNRFFEAQRDLQGRGFIGRGKRQAVIDVPNESTLLPDGDGIHHEQEHGEES